MKFYDITNKNIQVSFKEAVLRGFNIETGGFFMPAEFGKISPAMIYKNPPSSFRDIGFEIIKNFCGDEIPDGDLMSIIAQFYPHRLPINPIAPTTYILELFHGPTCNYKDIGAGFLAYLLEYFNKDEDREINLIVPASGERACAIAAAVSQVKGVKAILLCPKDSLTEIQENILSSIQKNVHAICVDGSFKDCENIVDKAIKDEYLLKKLKLVSGGALNIAPLLPQVAFFVYAALTVLYRSDYDNKIENPSIIASIPSGSFSALTAALIAKKMGTPIKGLISAENENHALSDWLTLGDYEKRPAVKTNTPALDIPNIINFKRMLQIYDFEELKKQIIPYWLDGMGTVSAVRSCNERTGYIIDPYGAMAWTAWQDVHNGALNSLKRKASEYDEEPGIPLKYAEVETWASSINRNSMVGIVLQTSHPAKFPEIMKPAIGRPPSLPDKLESLQYKPLKAVNLPPDYSAFKEWALSN
ncbi:threonine synthase [Treponema putidum]|uniref:pyridoxal-phosphate dependent enzyme n=1 Tax=Treponema putidum TaxID=221027 RepID=UPI0004F6731A|nr:pyridoxal-phosphate dependent enzyme [Treponema putidum]AIN92984.1 threonine synthase [Treponema putidum]TWI78456.1 threonine synthase [Treponema putidum]